MNRIKKADHSEHSQPRYCEVNPSDCAGWG